MTRNEILLITVGRVPAAVGDGLDRSLPGIFSLPCRSGRPLPNPTFAWNAQRRQYLADAVLDRLNPGSSACALAVADLDLYAPRLNFVFGLADHAGRRAIIALPRLRQTYYGLSDDTDLFRRRVLKEAVHELGHVSGLPHCDDRRCVMAFSNSLADTDFKSHDFCSGCRRQLRR
jgi:archaemetzincin